MTLYSIRVLINIFDLYIFRRYCETYIGKRRTTMEFSVALLILSEMAGSAVNLLDINWLNFITLVAILSIYVSQYDCRIKSKVVAVAMYMGLTAIAEPVGYMVYRIFADHLIQEEIVAYYFTVFVMAFFRAAVVELFCRIKSDKKVLVSLMPKEVVYALILIPLTSLVSCFRLISVASELISAQTIVLCMCIISMIIVTNHMVYTMVNSYTVMAEKRHEEEIIMQEAAYNQEYYEDMERYQELIQNIKHDMKNRLSALLDAAEQGDAVTVRGKLKEELGDIRFAEETLYSANPVLNSILKIKTAKAKEQGIEVSVEAFLPKKMNIEIGDMGVLYGNLLDNAIEACSRVEEGSRFISVETKYQEGNLLAVIKNSKKTGVNKSLQTTKGNRRYHGRGIRSVRRIAERYNGNLALDDRGDLFEAALLLTGIEKLE